MSIRKTVAERKTKETCIAVELDLDEPGSIDVETGVPFFDHLLGAAAFHGRFGLRVRAQGDTEVDFHHVVEDTGLVVGDALEKILAEHGEVERFGHSIIPMDEALSEAVVDVCGRSTLVFEPSFPQAMVGSFDVALIREFLSALAMRARIALHVRLIHGVNSHHMAESLFKALGRALKAAYTARSSHEGTDGMSTKGTIRV